MNRKRLLRGLFATALLSVLIYAVLAGLADVDAVTAAIRGMPSGTVVLMLALVLMGFTLRAVRWHYLTRVVGFPHSWRDAFYVQFSGITMTVTPGKVGEVLKAYLGRELTGMPMTRGISLVFSERLADLIAVIALSIGGVSILRGGWAPLAAVAVAVAVGTLVLSSRRFHELALKGVASRQWARRHHASATEISMTLRDTLAIKRLALPVGLSLLAWGAEGIAFWACVEALGFHGLGPSAAVAIYAASTVIGALMFLPGGIGFTEASLAGLLVAVGCDA